MFCISNLLIFIFLYISRKQRFCVLFCFPETTCCGIILNGPECLTGVTWNLQTIWHFVAFNPKSALTWDNTVFECARGGKTTLFFFVCFRWKRLPWRRARADSPAGGNKVATRARLPFVRRSCVLDSVTVSVCFWGRRRRIMAPHKPGSDHYRSAKTHSHPTHASSLTMSAAKRPKTEQLQADHELFLQAFESESRALSSLLSTAKKINSL